MPTVPKHSYKVEGSNGNTTKSVRNKLQTVETQPFLGVLFLPFFGSQHILFHRTFGVDKTITRTLASLSHCCVVETRSHKMHKKIHAFREGIPRGTPELLVPRRFRCKIPFQHCMSGKCHQQQISQQAFKIRSLQSVGVQHVNFFEKHGVSARGRNILFMKEILRRMQ